MTTTLVTFILLLAPAAPEQPKGREALAGGLQESEVWGREEGGLKWHHVFGLCRSRQGTVLAFCEGRIAPGDTDPHHLLLKRSTDRGKTWGKEIFVERSTRECYANPTPVVERRSGRIFLFYALNFRNERTEVFYRTSDDDGLSWSDRTDVTHLFARDPLQRPFHLPGPGHALQLSSGRLAVQVWHRVPISADMKSPPPEKRSYAAAAIVSDDDGRSWRAGDCTPAEFHANESRLVELADGQLLLNARSTGFAAAGIKRRVIARSTDGGLTWSTAAWGEAYPAFTPCDAGFIRLLEGPAKNDNWLLMSWPNHLTQRVNMTVGVSRDGGKTWPVQRQIAPLSGYSDLLELDDGSIGVLYGSGREGTRFARFRLDWLTAPPKKRCGGTIGKGNGTGEREQSALVRTCPSRGVPPWNIRAGTARLQDTQRYFFCEPPIGRHLA